MCTNIISILLLFSIGVRFASNQQIPNFDQNYILLWGKNQLKPSEQGKEIHLYLDNSSSGAGILSKMSYCSGDFSMKIKLPGHDSSGVVIIFKIESFTGFVSSNKVEFAFLSDTNQYVVRTSVYEIGIGDRPQMIRLWFDPASSFHNYKILWNAHQIVFFIDGVPVRVFRNNSKTGISFPTTPMRISASIWKGNALINREGINYTSTSINWSHAPFKASFRNFAIEGCPCNNLNQKSCYASKYWWNQEQHWRLNAHQEKLYENVRRDHMLYDYCTDKVKYHMPPPECSR